jgi:hypothetical protein
MSGVILKTKFHVILIALKLNEIKILEKKYLFSQNFLFLCIFFLYRQRFIFLINIFVFGDSKF